MKRKKGWRRKETKKMEVEESMWFLLDVHLQYRVLLSKRSCLQYMHSGHVFLGPFFSCSACGSPFVSDDIYGVLVS